MLSLQCHLSPQSLGQVLEMWECNEVPVSLSRLRVILDCGLAGEFLLLLFSFPCSPSLFCSWEREWMQWGTENKREEDTVLTLAVFALCGPIPFQCCPTLVQSRKTKNSTLPGTLLLGPAYQNPFASTCKCPHLDTSPEW